MITVYEANYIDARRELLLALDTYLSFVTDTVEYDNAWSYCDETFGYDLRVRAGFYAIAAGRYWENK